MSTLPRQSALVSVLTLLTGAGAGVVGALLNSLAIRLVEATGIDPGTGGLAKWLLAHLRAFGAPVPRAFGPIAQELFHTSVGLFTGVAYVAVRSFPPLRALPPLRAASHSCSRRGLCKRWSSSPGSAEVPSESITARPPSCPPFSSTPYSGSLSASPT